MGLYKQLSWLWKCQQLFPTKSLSWALPQGISMDGSCWHSMGMLEAVPVLLGDLGVRTLWNTEEFGDLGGSPRIWIWWVRSFASSSGIPGISR